MPSYQITSEPATEPITTAEAKAHLRVDFSDEDTYIDTLISTARGICETYCNRVFITQTWRQNEDRWSIPIKLKVNPVVSLTSLKYYDTNETQQTLTDSSANFQKDFNSDEAKIFEGLTNSYPSLGDTINPIEIIYVCGYGAASAVPVEIKHAIKLMVSHLYENREAVNVPIASMASQIEMPKAVRDLLSPFRIKHFG
jgi:uncharacterized phiE125 gp8 family phage protein|tara:strand:+ start:235 stop:828 length:594 start_codon:yes stop_codon:yes gene_type:complete